MSHFVKSGYNWIKRWLLYSARCISEYFWYILDQAMLEAWQKKYRETVTSNTDLVFSPVKEVNL